MSEVAAVSAEAAASFEALLVRNRILQTAHAKLYSQGSVDTRRGAVQLHPSPRGGGPIGLRHAAAAKTAPDPAAHGDPIPGIGIGLLASGFQRTDNRSGFVAIESSVAVATPGRRSLGQPIRFMATSPVLRGLALPLVLLGLWQLAASRHFVSSTFLPPPADVARAWWTWAFGERNPLSWTSGTFFEYSWLSARRVLIGFAIGSVIGVPCGVLIGYIRLVSDVLDPTIQALRPIPQTAWLPFAVLVFGIQEKAAIFLIAFGCFFPIVLNASAGARQTPKLLVRAALMLGTSRTKILRRVVIPNALPSIFTGLRLGLGLAWVLVIVAEMLAVRGGLGYAIWSSYTFIRMDLILAAIIAFGIYGWFSDRLLVLAGARVLRWQHGLVKD